MNPMFVIAAIRAAIRIGHTTADAYAQYAQEKPILLPDADRLPGDNFVLKIRRVANNNPEFANLLETDHELAKLWQDGQVKSGSPDEAMVYAVALRYVQRSARKNGHLGAQPDEEIAGGIMVGQWADGKGPVTPAIRVVVALADVALEYVGTHPQVLGVGGNGEKIIGAIASTIAETIPNADTRADLGPKDRFAERLGAIVLHAGLKTMSEKPELLFSESHLQALLRNVLPPVINALPGASVAEQVAWRNVADAFLGPAISAALGTVAANQTAFLGRKFAVEKAAGVMVTGLLNAAKEIDIKKGLSKEALLTLFQAAAQVAAENPELILGELLDSDLSDPENRKKADAIALSLFTSVAQALAKQQAPFGDDLGVAIATAVIDGIGKSGPILFNKDRPWQQVVGDILSHILDGFAETLSKQGTSLIATVFSKERLLDLVRVVVAQVAATPHMLITGNDELKRIVSAIAETMAQDKNLLLTADDWIKIAAVLAQEAALNPGRLFGLSDTTLQGRLATDIIGRLLQAAGDDLVRADRPVGPVMVGETLREAIIVTLRGIAGNVEQAFTTRVQIEKLAVKLNEAAAAHGLKMGGKEWLRLFRALLPGVLTDGEIPVLDDAKIASLLGRS